MSDAVIIDFATSMRRIADSLVGYESRPQQVALAQQIEQALADEETPVLAAQAGTGVGKSLAALIPAISSGKRTVYSTATKSLQSQLADKDLPFLQEHLGIPFSHAMLKGWSNYVCASRLNMSEVSPVKVSIRKLLDDGHDGDRDSIKTHISNAQWAEMSLPSEDCEGSSCAFFDECRPRIARDKAASADVVVVNHALLAANANLIAQIGKGALLSDFDVLIVDEVHLLEDIISTALTRDLTVRSVGLMTGKMTGLLGRYSSSPESSKAKVRELMVSSTTLLNSLNDGRLRQKWILENADSFMTVVGQLKELYSLVLEAEANEMDLDIDPTNTAKLARRVLSRELANKISFFSDIILKTDSDLVRLVESNGYGADRAVTLRTVPVDITKWAYDYIWGEVDTAILMSATVFASGNDKFITKRLGTGKVKTFDAGTAFDFKKQSLLYVPQIVDPSPANRSEWSKAILTEILDLINASSGRALVLFTSNREMNAAFDALSSRISYPVRRQGEESAAAMSRWFQEITDGVLFATRTFFQGSDFSGETCSMVIIDKLPFPVPSDPVIEARSEKIEATGGSSFSDLVMPLMSLTLAQAFGRLIRTKTDHGCVAILDSRLCDKSYGKSIIKSLPDAKLTRSMSDVTSFFAAIDSK